MSTRCQIGFYDETESPIKSPAMILYRHCDGYPGSIERNEYGVVPELLPYLKKFKEGRGEDRAYQRARVVHHLIQEHIPEGFLSYGIEVGRMELHGDIEFFYAVYPDRLEVWQTPFDMTLAQLQSKATMIETHPY